MPVLSLSMDLADSTCAKNKIQRRCTTLAHAHRQFELLARLFYRAETALYTRLVTEGVPITSIFQMKSIGDEVWVVIDLPDSGPSDAFNTRVAAVLRAAIATACQDVSFRYTKRPLTADEEAADPPKSTLRTVSVSLGVKIFVDLIDDAVETSQIRLDVFQKDLSSLLRTSGPSNARIPLVRPTAASILERLGGFTLTLAGQVKYRTDYIGPNVDHFFRAAKGAQVGRVAVGAWLLARLTDLSGKPLRPRPGRKIVVPAGKAIYRFSVAKHIRLRKKDLKGFRQGYDVYVLRDRSIEKVMATAGFVGVHGLRP
jgi:hypothetical protein